MYLRLPEPSCKITIEKVSPRIVQFYLKDYKFFVAPIAYWSLENIALALGIYHPEQGDIILFSQPHPVEPIAAATTLIKKISVKSFIPSARVEDKVLALHLANLQLVAASANCHYVLNTYDLKNAVVSRLIGMPLTTLHRWVVSYPIKKHYIFVACSHDRVPGQRYYGNTFQLWVNNLQSPTQQLTASIFARQPPTAISGDDQFFYLVNDDNEFSIFLINEHWPWLQTATKKVPHWEAPLAMPQQLIVNQSGNYAAMLSPQQISVFNWHGEAIRNIVLSNPKPDVMPTAAFLKSGMHEFIGVIHVDRLLIYPLMSTECCEIDLKEIATKSRTILNLSFVLSSYLAVTYLSAGGNLKLMTYFLPLDHISDRLPKAFVHQTLEPPSELRTLAAAADVASFSTHNDGGYLQPAPRPAALATATEYLHIDSLAASAQDTEQ